MMRKFLAALLFFLTFSSISNAQIILGIANYKYNGLNYMEAIPYYKYLYQKDTNDIFVLNRLANSYRLTKQLKEAEDYYSKIIRYDTSAEIKFHYAELLIENGNFDSAYNYISRADIFRKADKKLLAFYNTYKVQDQLSADSKNVYIVRLGFNDSESDFAPSIYKNSIIFASTRLSSTLIQRSHGWTDKLFVTMYQSTNLDNFTTADRFASKLKVKFNYGPGSFDKKNQKLYYSINNPNSRSKNGYKDLRISVAKYDEEKDKWKVEKSFPYNSKEYANTHPSVSYDGNKLYFSSNRPGGYGGMDIYVIEKLGDSAWSMPKNLGSGVNSSGDDVFPFIHGNDQLFFASNGRGGLGGLDVFVQYIQDSTHQAENMGEPLNSRYDDFGFTLYPKSEIGFFSTNRLAGGLDDDIYSYRRLSPRMKNIKFVVIDSLSKEKIYESKLTLISTNEESFVLKEGFMRHNILPNAEYLIEANAKGYFRKTQKNIFAWADTIYVIELKRLEKSCVLQGLISDNNSLEKIDSATVQLVDKITNEVIATTYSDSNGIYRFFDIVPFKEYIIQVSKSGYFSKSKTLTTAKCVKIAGTDYDYRVDVPLEKIVIGKAIKIDNIYFDLNKYNIRKDAAIELDKIVKMLNENPEIIIELSSHTDARGSDASNMTLSDNRAKSSAEYII
ncbi:MAG: OmpA family protein, partial [bacterium]